MTHALWYPEASKHQEPDNGSYTGGPPKLVLHTTESKSWASYKTGTKPHIEMCMQPDKKQCFFRQFYPFNQPARALVDIDNATRTNRDGAVQIEISGTCAPANKDWGIWYVANWPDWCYKELSDFVAWLHAEGWLQNYDHPKFLAYPSSYGANGVRLSASEWEKFGGVCGHQHVPENVHGDPGLIDMSKVIPRPQPTTYTVKAGDSIEGVAKKAGIPVARLWRLNRPRLHVGEKLNVTKGS